MKRTVAGIALILTLTPQALAAPERVPDLVQVTDIAGDANYLAQAEQDVAGPVQSEYGDILGGWFTQDAKSVTAHVRLASDPREAPTSLLLWMVADLGRDTTGNPDAPLDPVADYCMKFAAAIGNNPNDDGYVGGSAFDHCNTESLALASKVTVEELSDGSFAVVMRVSRTTSPRLRSGSLDSPRAIIMHRAHVAKGAFNAPFIDLTPTGRDYKLR